MIIYGVTTLTPVVETKPFHCPHCRSQRNGTVRAMNRWFTLYFIPIIPLGTRGHYVTCEYCSGEFSTDVLYTPMHQDGGSPFGSADPVPAMLADDPAASAAPSNPALEYGLAEEPTSRSAPAVAMPASLPSAHGYGSQDVGGPTSLPTTSGMAIASLVLSILSLFLCTLGILPALIGVVLGHIALSHIRKAEGQLTGTPLAALGLGAGYFSLLLWGSILAVGLFGGEDDPLPGRPGDQLAREEEGSDDVAPPATRNPKRDGGSGMEVWDETPLPKRWLDDPPVRGLDEVPSHEAPSRGVPPDERLPDLGRPFGGLPPIESPGFDDPPPSEPPSPPDDRPDDPPEPSPPSPPVVLQRLTKARSNLRLAVADEPHGNTPEAKLAAGEFVEEFRPAAASIPESPFGYRRSGEPKFVVHCELLDDRCLFLVGLTDRPTLDRAARQALQAAAWKAAQAAAKDRIEADAPLSVYFNASSGHGAILAGDRASATPTERYGDETELLRPFFDAASNL